MWRALFLVGTACGEERLDAAGADQERRSGTRRKGMLASRQRAPGRAIARSLYTAQVNRLRGKRWSRGISAGACPREPGNGTGRKTGIQSQFDCVW
jgi:hypothetical protein